MTLYANAFYFSRYFADVAERRFDTLAWVLHYLTITRVVYDTERGTWRRLMNPASPLGLIALVLVILYCGFWATGFRSVVRDLRDPAAYAELYERREDGRYRFVSYRRSFTDRN